MFVPDADKVPQKSANVPPHIPSWRDLIGKKLSVPTLVIVVGTALFLHLWRLGSVPRGFSGDECSIAYNAYSIALTGADEYGTRHPIFFRGLDVYYDPIDVYSVVLPVRVFGLQKWVARVPSAFFHLLACTALFILLRQWGFDTCLASAGGFTLSMVPWVFPLSRGCAYAGHTAALFGMSMGLFLTDSALRERSNLHAIAAGLTWGLTFYAHQSVQPVLICFAVGCAVVLWRQLLQRWRIVLVMMICALIVLMPLIIAALQLPEGLTARFHQVQVANGASSLRDMTEGVVSRYVDYFNLRFLFVSGDQEPRHHTGRGGELYWCLAPLILIKLCVAVRQCQCPAWNRVVLVGLLVSPISAALTVDRMHSTRSVYGVIFWLLLAMLGAQWLWQRGPPCRKLLVIIACAGTFEVFLYMHDYFGAYQTRAPDAFQTELTDALEYCFAHLKTNQVLYISRSTYTPYGSLVEADLKPLLYAHVLFFGKIDPSTYQRTGFPTKTVRKYDGNAPQPGLLLRCNYYFIHTKNGLVSGRDGTPIPPTAELIRSIPFSGHSSFVQYQVFAVP
jgi:hypothetical protein